MKRTLKRSDLSRYDADEKSVVTSYRWAWYALAFFVPFAGILTGLFLYDQDSREVRLVGRNCLLVGFIIWVIIPAIIAVITAVLLAVAAASWLTDMMPAAD